MFNYKSTAAAVALVLFGFVTAYVTVKQFVIPSGKMKIGIVDGERLKKESQPFQKVRQLLHDEQNKAHQEILPIETQLVKEQEEIRAIAKKQPDVAKRKREEFYTRVSDLERRIQQKRTSLDKQANTVSEMIEKTVYTVIDELAKKHQLNLVLNKIIDEKRAIFYMEDRMDMTDVVIQEIDKRLKNIALPKGE